MKPNYRILLITYFFAPIGTPRSFRWLNLTKELSRRNYSFDVLTIEASALHERYDSTLDSQIKTGGDLFRTYPGPIFSKRYKRPSKTSNGLSKSSSLLKNIARSFLIPDKSIEWFPWGYLKGKNLISKNKYDLIISSSYPFTSHILAYLFKKEFGIKWIADYGDPWSFNPDPKVLPAKRRKIDRAIEQHLLKICDKVMVTNNETKDGFIDNFNFLEDTSIAVLPQGYNPDEYKELSPVKGKKFRVVYTGRFYDKIREPFEFYKALKILFDIDIECLIVGNLEQSFMIESETIRFIGHQSHSRALRLQKGADLLLFFGNVSDYQIPGKIFEYFAAQRPILCIKYAEDDISAKLIKHYKRGVSVINRSEDIAATIKTTYYNWKNEKLDNLYNLDPIEDYTWKKMSNILADIITGTVANRS